MEKIFVLGAGTMGAGIVQAFAQKGYEVIVRDIKDEFVNRGIAGINNSKISNCFNLGEIMSDSSKTAYLGGISGQNTSKIDCCYTMNRYPISACSSSKIGYVAGETTNNITATYYLYDNEADSDEYGIPCTIEQLCDQNTYEILMMIFVCLL